MIKGLFLLATNGVVEEYPYINNGSPMNSGCTERDYENMLKSVIWTDRIPDYVKEHKQ